LFLYAVALMRSALSNAVRTAVTGSDDRSHLQIMKTILKELARVLASKPVGEAYDWLRLTLTKHAISKNEASFPQMVEPIWPLPRHKSDEDIVAGFQRHDLWQYAYAFEGSLEFPARHSDVRPDLDDPNRPLQRFRHFMPWLLDACGSLEGKRVLDVACNSGFWSFQCALLGAKEVVGFDARQEMIDQANFIKSIVGAENAQFQVLDFWDMSPDRLAGKFDVVLNLGILHHLSDTIEALKLTKIMSDSLILLDTEIYTPFPHLIDGTIKTSRSPITKLLWEEDSDIRMTVHPEIVMAPTKGSLEMMFRHLGCASWTEIPLRTMDMPRHYLLGQRASWLIYV
jgi:2-polyprenyl-3-methyl-5-hydroxy-6-metoxy-1,4-benzoquinol methylase